MTNYNRICYLMEEKFESPPLLHSKVLGVITQTVINLKKS